MTEENESSTSRACVHDTRELNVERVGDLYTADWLTASRMVSDQKQHDLGGWIVNEVRNGPRFSLTQKKIHSAPSMIELFLSMKEDVRLRLPGR